MAQPLKHTDDRSLEDRTGSSRSSPRRVPSAAKTDVRRALVEAAHCYQPPYDRSVDDAFAWHLVKYLDPRVAVQYRPRFNTPYADFTVDFLVEWEGRRVVFACGRTEEARHARFRDGLLLGVGMVDVAYHFREIDLEERLHDCLYLASRWDPDLFSERGRINLDTLASPEARAFVPRYDTDLFRLTYPYEADESLDVDPDAGLDGSQGAWSSDGAPSDLVLRRVSRVHPEPWTRDFERALARYQGGPGDLPERWALSA